MKKKIKLVFFHPYSYLGGADNSLQRLITNLNLSEFSITFVSLNKSYLNKIVNKKVIFKTINVSRTIFSTIKLREIVSNYEIFYGIANKRSHPTKSKRNKNQYTSHVTFRHLHSQRRKKL